MNKIEKGPAFWKAFGQAAALWAVVAVAGSLLLPGGSMTLPEEPEKMGWTVLRVCAVLPLGEELIFRGGVQRLLRPLGPGVALAGQAVLFAAAHGRLHIVEFGSHDGWCVKWNHLVTCITSRRWRRCWHHSQYNV